MKEILQHIKDIISIDSSSEKGTEAIVSYFAPYLEKAGFVIDYQKVWLENVQQVNLIAHRAPISKESQGLILHTHLDTVPPAPSNLWTETGGAPFLATLKGDKVFGLGTADVKLDFLCKVLAASTYSHKGLKQPLTLVGSFGEEIGLLGAKHLLQSGALSGKTAPGSYVLVGEPTNLALAVAHKGYKVVLLQIGGKQQISSRFPASLGTLHPTYSSIYSDREKVECGWEPQTSKLQNQESKFIVEVAFEGREAHSSSPDLGDNAIEKALEFLSTHSSVCGGLLEMSGGRSHNIIPGQCQIFLLTSESDRLKELLSQQGLKYGFLKKTEINRYNSADYNLTESGRDNHLLKMLTAFWVHWQDFKKVITKDRDPEFDPAHATCNLGKISASWEKIEIVLDLRTLPHQKPGIMEEKMEKFCREVIANYPHYQADVVISHENPPYLLPKSSRLLEESRNILQNLQGRADIIYKATSTEAGIYAKAGYETLIFGPGPSVGNVHAPNEYNLFSHLKVAMEFYEEIIARFCL